MDPVLATVCRDVFDAEPSRVDVFHVAPRGAERTTVRLHFPDRVVYATRRQNPDVTEKEARVLGALHAHDGPVPRVLTYRGGWLLVEEAGRRRLSQTLAEASPEDARGLLERAIDSLAVVHAAGRKAELEVLSFAHGEEMAKHLLTTLEAIGTLQGAPLPEFDWPGWSELVAQPGETFIKWDARAANAALDDEGQVRWFDWQHANMRHPGDDLVWLLCDEFAPEEAEPAALLVDTAHAWEGAAERACALGCAHVGVRIHGILNGPAGLDADFAECLVNDWLGSVESARRLCARGAALARHAAVTSPLVDWYRRLGETFG